MKNRDVQFYYQNMAKKIKRPEETRNKAKDFSKYDIEFMKQYSNKERVLLDLGSGTGLLVNHLCDDFKKIIAVEKFPEFSKFIKTHDKLEVVNQDIIAFETVESVDIISLFGVMNCFNQEEAIVIYNKVYDMLSNDGLLIIKNQMGVYQDVIVDGWSEELETEYFAEYRNVDSEISVLRTLGFTDIDKVDIYPQEYNRWDNTHFYALVCRK